LWFNGNVKRFEGSLPQLLPRLPELQFSDLALSNSGAQNHEILEKQNITRTGKLPYQNVSPKTKYPVRENSFAIDRKLA